MKIKWRKIRVSILVGQGILYRTFIILCNFLFFFLILNEAGKAAKFSLGWNAINICLYYMFHYVWARLFKLGKD